MADNCHWVRIKGLSKWVFCREHFHTKPANPLADCEELRPIITQDIVDIINKFVPLRRFKRYHIGICPFHEGDITQCLEVIRGTQRFRCIDLDVCGVGGTAIDFVCMYLHITPEKALEILQNVD